jgi:hypothetical protein
MQRTCVPEATVDEDGNARRREDDVRCSWKRPSKRQSEAEPTGEERATESHLRAGVSAAHRSHDPAATRFVLLDRHAKAAQSNF